MTQHVNAKTYRDQNMDDRDHNNVIEHILSRLNKIDKWLDTVGPALSRMDVYIARSDSLHTSVNECLKRYGDRLDKHDDRIREIELINAKTAPYVSMIERIVWVAIVLAVTAVSKFADFN